MKGYSPETKEELIAVLKNIEAWESEQKDLWFWEKLGRLPFQLLDRWTPQIVQKKIGEAVNEIGGYLQTGGKYLVSKDSVLKRFHSHGAIAEKNQSLTLKDISATLPISVMDLVADDLTKRGSRLAALQGASTGFGGLFTLALDIPAVLGMSLKVIQELAVCYGFDPDEKRERIFAIKCLQFASSDIVGKKAILEELSNFDAVSDQAQMISQLQGWREVVQSYRDNFGWKKLFQLVPIAGMLFGAIINRGTLQEVAEAARMLYRKRRVLERISRL
jgi:hypothetical protein